MLERILQALLWVSMIGIIVGFLYTGVYWAERQEAQHNEEQAARYIIRPAAAMSLPIPVERVEKTEGFIIFVDLRTGNLIEMPFCSVRSIEEVNR